MLPKPSKWHGRPANRHQGGRVESASEDFGKLNHENAVEALRARYRKSQQQEIDEVVADLLEQKDRPSPRSETIVALRETLAIKDQHIGELQSIITKYEDALSGTRVRSRVQLVRN